MKKRNVFLLGLLAVLLAIGMVFAGCGDKGDSSSPSGGNDIAVTFSSVSANGSATQTTTQLTLTFSQAIAGLSANDIALSGVSGVVKGTLSGSGPTYTLPVSGLSSSGTLTVAVAKSGYAISGSPKTTNVYFYSGGGGNDIVIILDSNDPYGWQKTYEPDSLFNGARIVQGDKYTFTYSFNSNVAMDKLQILFVDNCQATGYAWNALSGYIVIKENIAANTIVSGVVTITATGTATDATALANRLVFQAGTGTSQQPTLTFTTFNLVKDNGNGGGGTTLSGTYVLDAVYYYITFSSNYTFTGVYGLDPVSGTYAVSNNTVTLTIPGYGTETLTIVNTTTLRDQMGSDWILSNSGGTTVPSAPTGVTASRNSVDSTMVTVSWNAVSGATGYRVYYSSSGSGSGTLEGSPSATSFDSTGNSTTGTHYFRVSAVNSAGEGSPSSWVSVGPVSSGGGTAPSAPSGVSATAQSSSSISVTWSAVSGATSYDVYYEIGSSTTKNFAGNTTSTSYTHTGLTASTRYYYYIKAKNSSGDSDYSSSDSATTQASSGGGTTEYRLDQPTFGTCSRSGNNLTINWTLTTSGQNPTGAYTYTSPSSIIIQVYNGTSFENLPSSLSGSARTFTLNNYSAWQYSPEGVSGNRVTIRVLCKAPSTVTSGDRYATTTYFVESNYWSPSY